MYMDVADEAQWNYNYFWFCMILFRYVVVDDVHTVVSCIVGLDRCYTMVIQLNCRLYC